MAINERTDGESDDSQGGLAAQTASIAIVVLAVGILGLIVFFMPPKIKKIE